ncbi:MAG: C39 family peptidase [Patescibacteria group bacterium]
MKKNIITLLIVILLITSALLIYKNRSKIKNEVNLEKSEVILSEPETKNTNENSDQTKTATEQSLPDSAIIKMPFLVQAPFANWDPTHEDACEEASLIMVYHHINKTNISGQDQGEKEILDLVNYEGQNGYGLSITLEQLANISKSYFGLKNPRIVEDVTIENIKAEIADGKSVIIPAAGKILPNPNFKNGGPNYHMLVVKGYGDGYFITNDPGTKNGEGFKYKYEDLINAIHNWNADNILNGEKAYLVFD